MQKDIEELPLIIVRDGRVRSLFDYDDSRYVVPLYQRAFAWGTEKNSNRENEIVQLLDDIADSSPEENYYLGSLVVARKDSAYEVIDGQQRLTALFLLFNFLGVKIEKPNALGYVCRERSNYALRRIDDLIQDESRLDQQYEISIFEGIKTIRRKIQLEAARRPNYTAELIQALQRVVLFRICVPEGTDLNRYFEVMNTRGEQLEQHDIVKASLMRPLDENERQLFSDVWNACRDMTGYVQMHFNVKRRKDIFGAKWQDYPHIDGLMSGLTKDGGESARLSIRDVIDPAFQVDESDGVNDNDDRVRFESVIGFTYFLLHVLKVFVREKGIVSERPDEKLVGELLDDKLLITSFHDVRTKGVTAGGRIGDHDFSWGFLSCLLRCRFLFDKYIVKREYKDEDSDGEWSLQALKVSGSGSTQRPYYVKTEFRDPGEWGSTAADRTDRNRMLQACLRVSYTSPRVMHWITHLLAWLYISHKKGQEPISRCLRVTEGFVVKAVSGFVRAESHDLGVNTPHIVFNYLDYLLWRDCRGMDSGPFDFEFRNSVEHWHPQHPSDGMYGEMDRVDRFGNLCLIQSNVNAKFSNLSPDSKKSTFSDMVSKGSLKLRIMAKATVPQGGLTSTTYWRESACAKHEEEMLGILSKAIEVAEANT